MPNIYVSDETKKLLEKVSGRDRRTQDGEISFLCEERARELGIELEKEPAGPGLEQLPSDGTTQINNPVGQSQEKKAG
jgi:hypothetical protein